MPKITKNVIDNAKAPETGDTYIWDTELQGFGIRVNFTGRKTYIVRYRTKDAARQQRKMTLCQCNVATPADARQLARDAMLSVAAGNDPATERKPCKTTKPTNELTLEALFKARIVYLREKGKVMADNVERLLLLAKNNAADFLGRDTSPAELQPADIVRYLGTFYAAGHRGGADKARAYLAATFSWAIKSANDYTVTNPTNWGITVNPAAAVAKDHGAMCPRDRNLSVDNLRTFWEACQNGNGGFSKSMELCFKLMLACGQRVQETLRVDGREIDLEKRVWNMPAEKSKLRKVHTIHLPDIIIEDLREAKERHGDGPLFPARATSKDPILKSISVAQALAHWCDTNGKDIERFQPRDLRRTWKSRAHDAGVDRFTRDLIQQHSQGSDAGSKHYDRADYEPQKREAMDKWNAWLTAAVAPDPEPEQLAA